MLMKGLADDRPATGPKLKVLLRVVWFGWLNNAEVQMAGFRTGTHKFNKRGSTQRST